MVFVDGENLAIRFNNSLESKPVARHVKHLKDVYVWTNHLNFYNLLNCAFVRSHYYTCAKGDHDKIESIENQLLECGITDPRVFKKNTGGRSKRVDITLATEMLSHAYNDNFEVAVLVAGDEDYVPLVQEVKRTGKQVALWFLADGLSHHLKKESDLFMDLQEYFLEPEAP